MSIAQAFANAPAARKAAAADDKPTGDLALQQLQAIPTSARMVMTPRRVIGSSRKQRIVGGTWKPEPPSTARRSTSPEAAAGAQPVTIPDRSALPYLLGGCFTLGTNVRDRPSRAGTRGSNRAPSRDARASAHPNVPRVLPNLPTPRSARLLSTATAVGANAMTPQSPQSPGSFSLTTRRDTLHRLHCAACALNGPCTEQTLLPTAKCAAGCNMCHRIQSDVRTFERMHPDAFDPDWDGDRDTPTLETSTSNHNLRASITGNYAAPAAMARSVSKRLEPMRLGNGSGLADDRLGSPTSGRGVSAVTDDGNPLAGLLSCLELHEINQRYQQFLLRLDAAGRAPPPDRAAQPTAPAPLSTGVTVLRVGLTVHDFHALLNALVPHVDVSPAYAQRMFEPFAISSHPPRAPFAAIFGFLCRKNGSTVVDRNMRFFLQCLDDRHVGRLTGRILSHGIIRAWAENRVIGTAIFAWRRVAEAFEAARPAAWTNETLLSPDDLRAAVYGSKQLHEAFLEPLECVLTDAPRYSLKPAPPQGLVKLSFRRGSQTSAGDADTAHRGRGASPPVATPPQRPAGVLPHRKA
jgi:hypothetical protein